MREQAKLATDSVFSEESVSKPREDEKGKGTHLKFGRRSVNKRKETNPRHRFKPGKYKPTNSGMPFMQQASQLE